MLGQAIAISATRRRRARQAGWALIALCASLFVGWYTGFGFTLWRLGVQSDHGQIVAAWGDAHNRRLYWNAAELLTRTYQPPTDAWSTERINDQDDLARTHYPTTLQIVRFPLWPLPLLIGSIGAILLVKTRTRRAHDRRALLGWSFVAAGSLCTAAWVVSGWFSPTLNLAPYWLDLSVGVGGVTRHASRPSDIWPFLESLTDNEEDPISLMGGKWLLWPGKY